MPANPEDFSLEFWQADGFRVAVYPPGAAFGPRQLRDFEFVWIMEGDAVYTRNGIACNAPQGAVLLCQPEATDEFRWDRERRTRHAYFHFTIKGDLPGSWPRLQDWPLLRHPQREDDLLHALFQHLLGWNGRGDPTQTQLLAKCLLAAFVTGETEGSEVRADDLPEPVSRTFVFITETLDRDPSARITLTELAAAACVTPEYLCRLFTRAMGQTPMEALRRSRLERARVLLARTNFSVTEIAHLTGFESPFHFSRLIKRTYGLSPRDLRQSMVAGRRIPGFPSL